MNNKDIMEPQDSDDQEGIDNLAQSEYPIDESDEEGTEEPQGWNFVRLF